MFRAKHAHPEGTRYAPSRSHVYSDLEVRQIDDHQGVGVFAAEDIVSGTIVAIDGGLVLDSVADFPPQRRYAALIAEGVFLAPHDLDNPDVVSHLNHSCAANLARIGGLVYVAKTDIRDGEHLTVDYAPFVAGTADWRMDCHCGSAACRRVISGDDWQDPGLARSLWTEWLPYIQRRILSLHQR